jgi:hypothetical protein
MFVPHRKHVTSPLLPQQVNAVYKFVEPREVEWTSINYEGCRLLGCYYSTVLQLC